MRLLIGWKVSRDQWALCLNLGIPYSGTRKLLFQNGSRPRGVTVTVKAIWMASGSTFSQCCVLGSQLSKFFSFFCWGNYYPWPFSGFYASVASTWFSLRHARLKVVVLQPTVVSRFGCFVFEIWVLRASVFVFECFPYETCSAVQRHKIASK